MRKTNLLAVTFAGFLLILLTASCATPLPEQPVDEPPAPEQAYQPLLYTLSGVAFHDYSGDGIRQDNEPAIPGVEVDLYSGESLVKSASTNADGIYSIQLEEMGSYTLYVNRNNILGHNDRPYRYLSISNAEYKKIADALEIEVDGNVDKDIGLMQGFLTLPFRPDTEFLGDDQAGAYPSPPVQDQTGGYTRYYRVY